MTEEQKALIKEAVGPDGKLTCARAFQLSVELDVSLRAIGLFCDEEGIKIKNCQLGTFP